MMFKLPTHVVILSVQGGGSDDALLCWDLRAAMEVVDLAAAEGIQASLFAVASENEVVTVPGLRVLGDGMGYFA